MIRLKILFLFICCTLLPQLLHSQQTVLVSPNKKISVALYNTNQNQLTGDWYLAISYTDSSRSTVVIPRIDLGLVTKTQDFSKRLTYIKHGKTLPVNESYTMLHGKRSACSNSGNEQVIFLKNNNNVRLNIIVRAYNDGVVFRYELPEKKGQAIVEDELTAYTIPADNKRWLEKWNPANEGLYTTMDNKSMQQGEWCYPALFSAANKSCWFLLHEADLNRNYCGSKLSNAAEPSKYKITFPNPADARGTGNSQPTVTLPFRSPWRAVIIGSLKDIVASTLIDDVSAPSTLKNTDWIKPGLVSWNYWSNNHGTKDYKTVIKFADLAAEMGWPYTLLDWEWDAMANGGNLEDATRYILSKGVKPLIWYNSGGNHTWVPATPKDRMLTHQNRVEEFTKLKKMGVAGVKIDFFESEKQDMIQYYIDILEDAAQYEMMVYFHGSLVPRGWSRTYPHFMTSEAVRGAEWYNNVPDFTMAAPEHNTILPFTRNVIGPMDYTPVTFTNSQYPHVTSYGHELALSVVFESGLQHMADRPEGYLDLPAAARRFLMEVPVAWDETRLIDGYPGKEIIIARRKGEKWYIGGISSEQKEKSKTLKLDFLKDNITYKLTLIADGEHDKDFKTTYTVVDKSSTLNVKLLRRGGFVACITPVE
ncbi:glycoside hydrolase family 97 protein [Flavobacterium rhizosphaerae]|uniref:Glycoside hydrolase family 97 catalytic domain-containing protein n=1 Tax=Flavobacterium rhizosphaerae TaxID=3163298 RepID=A0ABW8YYX9_9FLAO